MDTTATRSSHRPREGLALLAFLAVMFGTGAIGAFVTYPEITGWYADLPKPDWTPPNGVFAPVWNTIFLLTALSGWLCWRRTGLDAAWGVPYGMQAVLNALWSVMFFTLHSPPGALVIIAALLGTLLSLLVVAWQIRPLAGALLVPYVGWVSFASALNLAIAS